MEGQEQGNYEEDLQASQDSLMTENDDIFLSFEFHDNRL